MNDLLSLLREHIKIVALAAVVVLFVSAGIGLLVGLSRHDPASESLGEVQLQRAETAGGLDAAGLLVPPPVRPSLVEDDTSSMLYFDRHPESIEEIRPVPVTLSELIEHRRRGVPADIKPFLFMGEELDILTYENELAEP